MAGDTVVVGATFEDGGGAAYVFVRSGAFWSQQARLTRPQRERVLRSSVAIAGDTVVVGAT